MALPPLRPPYSFLDWSGDIGFDLNDPTTSSHLVVAVVGTVDYDSLRREMGELRAHLRLPLDYHFHHARVPRRIRRAFSQALPGMAFAAAALVVAKRELPRRYAHFREPDLYAHLIADLLWQAPVESFWAKRLLVDEGRAKTTALVKQTRIEVSRVLRERGLEHLPKIRGEPAANWDGIQVADMIAGELATQETSGKSYLSCTGRISVFRYRPK